MKNNCKDVLYCFRTWFDRKKNRERIVEARREVTHGGRHTSSRDGDTDHRREAAKLRSYHSRSSARARALTPRNTETRPTPYGQTPNSATPNQNEIILNKLISTLVEIKQQ